MGSSTTKGRKSPGKYLPGSEPLEELELTTHIRSNPSSILHLAASSLLGLAVAVTATLQALAQASTTPIDHLEVALWPEYDQQAMLVIYRFNIPPNTPLPARVSLPIPTSSGQPHAVAWQDDDGSLYEASFTLDLQDGWSVVEVELLGSHSGQLEYYADLDFAGTVRSFLFEWPLGYELGGMSYEVQEPVSATDFKVVPEPQTESQGNFGLNYAFTDMGPQSADSAPVISVTYEKSTPTLSIDALQPLGQATPSVGAPSGTSDLLPWLLAAAGVIFLGGGVYYFAFRRQPARQQAPRRRRKRASDVELEASTVYCHNCGAAAGISDVYCRQCGTQLRRS